MKNFYKKRKLFLLNFTILFIVEVIIALFVHDKFIRPYIGDMLIVILLYFAVRSIYPKEIKGLVIYIFLFAVLVEVSQYFNILKLVNLEQNKVLKIILGTSFDIKDILCYFIGCLLIQGISSISAIRTIGTSVNENPKD